MEAIFHYLLAVLPVLALFPKIDKRLLLILSPLAIIPDLDHLVASRTMLYNVFFLAAVLAIVWLLFKQNRKTAVLLALFFLGSHYLLDLGDPGFAFFYPVSEQKFQVNYLLYADNSDGKLGSLHQIFLVNEKIPKEILFAQRSTLLSIQTIMFAFIVACLFAVRQWQQRTKA